jgi:exodeoxyribonuclease V gamma subunit
VSLFEEADEVADRLPVELDALERYGVGQRLLDSVLAGIDGSAAIRAEIARGTLPPGVLGWPVVRSLWQEVEAIAARARELAPAGGVDADLIDVRLELPDGRLLSGTVPLANEDLILEAAFSRLAPRHRLVAWVRLLAASAAEPARPLSAATVGRAASSREEAIGALARIPPLGTAPDERAALARAALAVIVDLHDRGMREALPLPCATAAAYAAAARRDANRVAAARPKWESDWKFSREDADADHVLAFGGVQPFEWLLATAPRADERGDGWAEEEPSRFGRFSRRLWDGLLAREELTSW